MSVLKFGIAGWLLAVGLPAAVAAPASQTVLAKTADGAWSLQARQADLPKLLDDIAARTGTRLHYTLPPQAPVDATCVGANATELLQCLLGAGANLVFKRTDGGDEIWIVGSSLAQATGGACAAAAPASTPATETRAKADATEQWLKQANAKDPAARAQAVAELANADVKYDAKVRAALHKALNDSKPLVRMQAIGAAASRDGEAGAGEQLRQALNDSDVEVRLTALDYIDQDSALLQMAAQDSDPAVRELAEAKLESLNKP